MSIVITGASGFLGKEVVRQLSDRKLLLLGRSKARLQETFPEQAGLTLLETDYSPDSLRNIFASADAVVHLAAQRYQKQFRCLSEYSDNIKDCDSIFHVCQDIGITNVVFASTIGVYSDRFNSPPFQETEAVFPQNLYALSKLIGESLGFMRGLKFKSLRFAQLVGLGEREGFMLSTFINRALEGEDLILFGKGKGRREYLYVKDAATAIEAALDYPAVSGVFNVGLGESTSHREFAESVCRTFGENRVSVMSDPSRSEDTSVFLMDGRKVRKEFAWLPAYSLEDALREMKSET